ncbi:RNA polymerase sigma factor [Paraconexibacter antarcticus]|uniref:RNA polymerase sigma factor n=1 Tax=Paraconexibacter antarcticus TaxID=2949664 RepID=A0ABY5DYG7_9ACTN|nr:RNA polymerase sigma factor [Paraconexibacter antarcticus]UTI65655.1 RNA polymerase sigma factor [Paraconexibacter antarcticus]
MEASALRAPAALAPRRPAGVLLRLRSDEQLVALFRQGNEDAFRLIHDRYRQRLSAYARQMLGGSATDADDAMQDVFLRAYAALRADDRPVTLRAWLYRVAHNRCIDHLRRPASQPTVELSESARPLPATTGDPILAAERREDLRRLVLDVRALPEQQRSALLMREMEGLSYQELAAALDVTIPAVKSLLVRARMGLVESQQARDTPCQSIREDIVSAHDRGVRASGRARRHVRECPGCAGYRATLRGISGGLSALNPSPGPWAAIAKLVGIGAGGSGAAGGAAAAGVGGAAAGVTAGSTGGAVVAGAAATKLAAVVAAAALVGGSVEVAREQAAPHPREAPAAAAHAAGPRAAAGLPAHTAAAAAAASALVRPGDRLRPPAGPAVRHRRHVARTATAPGPALPAAPDAVPAVRPAHDGGAEAPAEDPAGAGTDAGTGLGGLLGALGGSDPASASGPGSASASGGTTGSGETPSTSGTGPASGSGSSSGPGSGSGSGSGSSTGSGSTTGTSSGGTTASGAQVTAPATGSGGSGGGAGAPSGATPSGS